MPAAITFRQACSYPRNRQKGCYQFCCLVNRGSMGVSSLPKTVTRQRSDCDLNPGLLALVQHATARLSSHHISSIPYHKVQNVDRRQVYRLQRPKVPFRETCKVQRVACLSVRGHISKNQTHKLRQISVACLLYFTCTLIAAYSGEPQYFLLFN